jgi:TPR repeat protein
VRSGSRSKQFRFLPTAFFLFAGLGTCVGSAAADFNEGLAAFLREDYATALEEFKPLAEQGHPASQFYMGTLYYEGSGVPKDYSRAVQWWFKAAQQGSSGAENSIGIAYLHGEGVERDETVAAEWIRKAADGGLAEAQNILGGLYLDGTGVQQDDVQAVKWYSKAATQGCPFAQGNLGYLYLQKRGGPSDHYERTVEFIKWIKLSAMKGVNSSIKMLDNIEKNPPPSDVMAEADRRVRQWQPIVHPDRVVPAWWLHGRVNC